MKKQKLARYTPVSFTLRVKRSATGKGLFTDIDIPKGSCIIEYVGEPVSAEVAKRDEGKYFFELYPGKTIDGNIKENLARYINHSCVPNCESGGPPDRVFIYALTRIPAGSELTYDYGDEYFNKHIKPKGCACHKCRRYTI